MHELDCINLSALDVQSHPFQHFSTADVLMNGLEQQLHNWFENEVDWDFTEADFYTQFEISLLGIDLPDALKGLRKDQTIEGVKRALRQVFNKADFELVGITAHKLVNGHKIGVHNDYIEGEETHRFIIQINPSWSADNGGFLMLFSSPDAADVVKIVQPLNNTGFGFEISPVSFHAVSTVYSYSRYTLVYTFKERKE